MKILLIVEDNVKMRRMIKSLFAESNYHLIECEDGSEALAAYNQYNPDWVLMDIMMKRLDGISATKQILNYYPNAKVIIVTDYDDNELRKQAESAGAYNYVLKEDLQSLFEIIN
jgi:CheY-like chemotaxis protein